ncbi:MAG: hypothetical protein KDE22_10390 [Rhodobacterales bacterium]|nr:hypothetical protein [Rhodobacterales bacterium]
MRTHLHIDLAQRAVTEETVEGVEIARGGRYRIARMLTDMDVAGVDPLSPANPLIFANGPFAGTNFSNGNRMSVGCKSPLTGGIKEANTGGTFGFALGQLQICGLTLYGASDDWIIIRIPKEGPVTFEPADAFMGMGNFETAARLHEAYGDKVSIALCGPVGEYQGLLAGIAFSDPENRPARLAARGGVGAVMGSKKVKAIIADKFKMPPFHDRRKLMGGIKAYGDLLGQDPGVKNLNLYGTAYVADVTNHIGGLPVRNFSAGRLVDKDVEVLKVGGHHIREQNTERGGETAHACMPGCLIKCSNVYADKDGQEVVSPLEYETIGLMGTNCGLTDPDDIARVNAIANDLGIDTIEAGALMAVLMEAGQAPFGDVDFMVAALAEIRAGNERGRLLAQGTGRVGRHFGVARIPVIKDQAISAYDPRVIEVTGITMMVTPQGADHTAGNMPAYPCDDKDTDHLAEVSLTAQINAAAADSLGICVFGKGVTDKNAPLIAQAINDAHDAGVDDGFLRALGSETLRLERAFNRAAGLTDADDELPAFFLSEPLAPTNKVARHTVADVNRVMEMGLAG